MGCSRIIGLVMSHLVADLIGLAVRLLSALLLFLVPLVLRLLLLVLAWLLISLTAIPSPIRSADSIADRIIDQVVQAGFWNVPKLMLKRILQGLVLVGFIIGWGLEILIVIELVQWIFQ